MIIVNKAVKIDDNCSLDHVKISNKIINRKNYLIELTLCTTQILSNSICNYRVGFRIERIHEDSVYYEIMLSNGMFRLENNIFSMEESDLMGTLSGSNLEDEFFFTGTIDLSLSNFFSTSVPTFSINLQMFKKIFEDDDSPDMSKPGTYKYTFVFLPENDYGMNDSLYVRNEKKQSIKIPLNKNPVQFSTDEFNFEKNIVNMITGMYTIT